MAVQIKKTVDVDGKKVQKTVNVVGQPYLAHRYMMRNLLHALGRPNVPQLVPQAAHDRTLLVVAGGQSVTGLYKEIAERAKDPNTDVYTCNAMHDILREMGIPVKFHLVVDPREKHLKYVQKPHKDTTYWIASQVDPRVFDALEGHNVYQWHCCNTGLEMSPLLGFAELNNTNFLLIRTGCTAGLCGLTVGYSQGYRKFVLYGFDSCYSDDGTKHHAYDTDQVDTNVQDVVIAGKQFKAVYWMIQQGKDFNNLFEQLHDADIVVRGDGMIPYAWAQLYINKKKNPALPGAVYNTRYQSTIKEVFDKMAI